MLRHNPALQGLRRLLRRGAAPRLSAETLFGSVQIDPEAQARQRAYPLPGTRCVIYFTPRSGSSWLSDILSRTRCLGHANEVFNPRFMPRIAQSIQADTLPDYVDLIQRRLNTKGVFSAEITWHQLAAVFGTGAAFMRHFGTADSVWLIRRDIVAQAVSLAKMEKTQLSHAPRSDAQSRDAAEQAFSYDPVLIQYWLRHIFHAEERTEAHFARYGLTPMRLDYETVTRAGAEAVTSAFASHLGIALDRPAVTESAHTKLGTSQNRLFAERFRAEKASWLAKLARKRQPWLDRLDLLPPRP